MSYWNQKALFLRPQKRILVALLLLGVGSLTFPHYAQAAISLGFITDFLGPAQGLQEDSQLNKDIAEGTLNEGAKQWLDKNADNDTVAIIDGFADDPATQRNFANYFNYAYGTVSPNSPIKDKILGGGVKVVVASYGNLGGLAVPTDISPLLDEVAQPPLWIQIGMGVKDFYDAAGNVWAAFRDNTQEKEPQTNENKKEAVQQPKAPAQKVNQQPLSVNLSLWPSNGAAPVVITLKATVSGSAQGTINYTFYCDRSDSGTNIISGWDAKFDGISDNPKTVTCKYTTPGTYTAKVIAERGTLQTEARATVKIDSSSVPSLNQAEKQASVSAAIVSGTIVDSEGNPAVATNYEASVSSTMAGPPILSITNLNTGESPAVSECRFENATICSIYVDSATGRIKFNRKILPGHYLLKATIPGDYYHKGETVLGSKEFSVSAGQENVDLGNIILTGIKANF